MPEMNSGTADPMAGLKLFLSWLFVGIPAGWGIYKVVMTSMALFK
jgi:hypothetical protein